MAQETCSNPAVCERIFEEIDDRLTRLEDDTWKKELSDSISDLRVSVANLNGRIAGYLVAGSMLGAGLSAVVQYLMKAKP